MATTDHPFCTVCWRRKCVNPDKCETIAIREGRERRGSLMGSLMDRPFQEHSETSRAAADAIEDPRSLRQRVLDYLTERGPAGATDDEMQVALNMNPSTQRPRRIELWERGQVVESMCRRKTRSDRWAVVWAVSGQCLPVIRKPKPCPTCDKLRALLIAARRFSFEHEATCSPNGEPCECGANVLTMQIEDALGE